jgi:hypothetical protein
MLRIVYRRREITYVHIEDARPWIHRFTSGVRLTFGPPAIAVGRADVSDFSTRNSTRNTTARHKGEPSRRKSRRNINLPNSRGGTRTRDPGIMSDNPSEGSTPPQREHAE